MRALYLAAGFILASSLAIKADNTKETNGLPSSHKIIYVGGEQKTPEPSVSDSLITIFYEDQFRNAQDPRAPYFLFMSRDAKIAMGVGGKVQGNLFYGFNGTIDGTDFLPYKIPVPNDPTSNTRFEAGMAQSSILFTVFGRSKYGNYLVNVQGKFSGPNNTFKLNQAYITMGHITLGQAKSTFCDPAAMPSTVETQGASGGVNSNAILLRYMYTFAKKFTIAASIENPKNQYLTTDGVTASTADCAPNVAAFLQYGETGQHIRLALKGKDMRYRNLLTGKNHHVAGYGLALTGVGKIFGPVTFYGGANYGKGIGSSLHNLSVGYNDLLSYSSTAGDDYGHMYAPETFAYFAALQYNFSPTVFSTVVFSQDRIYTKSNTDYGPTAYRYGLYAVANVFWNLTPRMQLGAEFDWGRRVDISGQANNAHRISLMGAFSF